ncbi:hypothetical protein VNO78_10056 [Psophocarpus tetragonolobus]|uniref:Uncharacterized protein n=1 Tax=Psophocarpus tetragonolobus TaxID=3891 RepID=A0AAN9SKK0_PSOTE
MSFGVLFYVLLRKLIEENHILQLKIDGLIYRMFPLLFSLFLSYGLCNEPCDFASSYHHFRNLTPFRLVPLSLLSSLPYAYPLLIGSTVVSCLEILWCPINVETLPPYSSILSFLGISDYWKSLREVRRELDRTVSYGMNEAYDICMQSWTGCVSLIRMEGLWVSEVWFPGTMLLQLNDYGLILFMKSIAAIKSFVARII